MVEIPTIIGTSIEVVSVKIHNPTLYISGIQYLEHITWRLFVRLLLLTGILLIGTACNSKSGSGPKNAESPEKTYSAVYAYPSNDLEPGDGSVEVSAIGIISCKDEDDNEVDEELCESFTEAPKVTHVSPAGSREIVVNGNTETRTFLEGATTGTLVGLVCGNSAQVNIDLACVNKRFVDFKGEGSVFCAISNAKKIQCFGSNNGGQLGIDNTNDQTSPVTMTEFGSVKSLALGGNQTCAILEDDTVKCAGLNWAGQLGSGDTNTNATPIVIPGFEGAVKLYAASLNTCALFADNTVKCTGFNNNSQISAVPGNVLVPTVIDGLTGVRDLAVGDNRICALMLDNSVKCAGGNSYGELGLGDTVARTSYVDVPDLNGAKQIVMGMSMDEFWTTYHWTCALMSDDTVKCAGESMETDYGSSFVSIAELSNVRSLALGKGNVCAILQNGSVKCKGSNWDGQLGLGDTSTKTSFETVAAFQGAEKMAGGWPGMCALFPDGQIKCSGLTTFGSNEPVVIPFDVI